MINPIGEMEEDTLRFLMRSGTLLQQGLAAEWLRMLQFSKKDINKKPSCDKSDSEMQEHIEKYHKDEKPLVRCPKCHVWVKVLWMPFSVDHDLDSTAQCMLCIETARRERQRRHRTKLKGVDDEDILAVAKG